MRIRLGAMCVRGVVALASTLLCTAAFAAGEPAAHYYDGARRITITPQADLVARFARAPGQAAALAAPSGTTPLPGVGDSKVRIFRVTGAATRSAAPDTADGSPVFREGDSPAGRLMTLPGGVLVKFRPEWSRTRIDAWAASRGVTIERQLAIDGNWFVLRTAAGLASLQAANRIYESGDVLAASPNWWKHMVTR